MVDGRRWFFLNLKCRSDFIQCSEFVISVTKLVDGTSYCIVASNLRLVQLSCHWCYSPLPSVQTDYLVDYFHHLKEEKAT